MYNQELKAKFIKGYTTSISTSKVCETVFKKFAPHEEKWGDDLCTKSAEDLQPVIDDLVGMRARSKYMRLIILKDYVRWCIGMGVPNACDGMLNITNVGLDKMRRQTVVNPDHLQQYLEDVCAPASECTTDNIYRCYYWLAYAGMDDEDILNVKCSDVDFKKMVVNYPRRHTTVPIYTQSLEAFHNCVELEQFVYKHPNYTKTVWKDRVPGDTLVRGIKSASTSIKAFRSALARLSKSAEKKTTLELSYFRVWISGIFYRMNEKEKLGIEPNFNSIVSQQMEGKVYKLDIGRNTMEAKHRQLVNDYVEDYQRWKLAWLYRG